MLVLQVHFVLGAQQQDDYGRNGQFSARGRHRGARVCVGKGPQEWAGCDPGQRFAREPPLFWSSLEGWTNRSASLSMTRLSLFGAAGVVGHQRPDQGYCGQYGGQVRRARLHPGPVPLQDRIRGRGGQPPPLRTRLARSHAGLTLRDVRQGASAVQRGGCVRPRAPPPAVHPASLLTPAAAGSRTPRHQQRT